MKQELLDNYLRADVPDDEVIRKINEKPNPNLCDFLEPYGYTYVYGKYVYSDAYNELKKALTAITETKIHPDLWIVMEAGLCNLFENPRYQDMLGTSSDITGLFKSCSSIIEQYM